MKNPIIKKTANGYFVYPDNKFKEVEDHEVYVFESFESLVKQLKAWLEETEK